MPRRTARSGDARSCVRLFRALATAALLATGNVAFGQAPAPLSALPATPVSASVATAASAPRATVVSAPRATVVEAPSRALLHELTQQTRLAGTVGSKVAAEHVAAHLREYGFTVAFDDREVLLSLPRRIEFEVFDETNDPRPLHERRERFDPDAIPPGDVPLCNGWSASGEVRAQVVDVGRGLRADFERLRAAGVDVKGKVALARYGGAYRGIKVDLATQYGCAAVLLFHEQRRDGEAWPYGPWKPGHDGERGSISPMGRIPGDPSTPGWPSPHPGESARRLQGEELASALPRIPCIPIGWAEAEMLLDRLAPRADVDAQGAPVLGADGKPVTRPVGPGPAEVRVLVDQPRDVRTIRSVIATLPGADADVVIAGNHRDAWVRGANDAGSGTIAMLRAAQHLSERVRQGWKPPHTIQLCFWDAEEFGLIGSTEWGEANADFVRRHAIAYVNTDVGVSGTHFRGVSGTPGLLGVLESALQRVPMPAPRGEDEPATMLDDWKAWMALKAAEAGPAPADADSRGKPDPVETPREIEMAGSGSDFAVFLHHLSVPTLDIGLGGNSSGQYHTNFDDFAIVDRYVDPGFVGHELCGHLLDELLFALCERGRESFDAREAARTLAGAGRNEGLREKDRWLSAPQAARLEAAFMRLARTCEAAPGRSAPIYRLLEDVNGVPGRVWYRNVLWTPGLETGYASEVFPTLRAVANDPVALDAAVERFVARVDAVSLSIAADPVKARASAAPAAPMAPATDGAPR